MAEESPATPAVAKVNIGIVFLIALAFFLPWLPKTVQYGDAGELVGNALAGRLSHPPGFPLYHWLYAFFLKLPLGITPFAQAALLSCALMAGAIALVARNLRPVPALALAALLATNGAILRQALLPDVFSLAILLAAALLALARTEIPASRKFPAMVAVFALGLAAHPSLLFLAPVLIAPLARREVTRKSLAIGGALGLFLLAGLYASLVFLDREGVFAWPSRPGLTGILQHLVRADYGSFRLSVAGGHSALGRNLLHFLGTAWPLLLSLAAGAAFVFSAGKKSELPRERALLFSLGIYLVAFYGLANVNPSGFGGFVLERFHALPVLLLAFLSAAAAEKIQLARRAELLLLALVASCAGLTAFQEIPRNQWQKDTVLEDLALNFRDLAAQAGKACTLVFVDADSVWGALNYLEATMPPLRPTQVVTTGLMGLEEYQARLALGGIPLKQRRSEHGEMFDIENDLIRPVLERCDVFTLEGYRGGDARKVVFYPLGRKLTEGRGEATELAGLDALKLRSRPPAEPGPYSPAKFHFAHYAKLPLYLGRAAAEQGRWEEAKQWFGRAVTIAPYLTVARQNLCVSLRNAGENAAADECDQTLEIQKRHEIPYL